MDSSVLKKRMVRLAQVFHRRMNDDPRLSSVVANIDNIEKTINDIKRDFLVAAQPVSMPDPAPEPVVEEVAAPVVPKKSPVAKSKKKATKK